MSAAIKSSIKINVFCDCRDSDDITANASVTVDDKPEMVGFRYGRGKTTDEAVIDALESVITAIKRRPASE